MFEKIRQLRNPRPLILNIAAGNILPTWLNEFENYYIINVDTFYFPEIAFTAGEAYKDYYLSRKSVEAKIIHVNHDIYDFLWRWTQPFDIIAIYRFLEHVPRTKVLEFIYQLSRVSRPGTTVIDIIVPDYQVIADRILKENVWDPSFPAEDIITSTELLNEPDSPHQSIWTKDRMEYFWGLEERFKVVEQVTPFPFDGRITHLRSEIHRI